MYIGPASVFLLYLDLTSGLCRAVLPMYLVSPIGLPAYFCVEVLEKIISRTKMIDHSLERYYNGVCYRLYKNIVRGYCCARLKLRNCVLTMMLSTNRYKKHSRVFSRSFFNFCRSFKALQYPNQKILTK